MIDLHTHSTRSDGSMSPIELIDHAKKSGLEAISLTDHDTADGVKEAMTRGAEIGIEVVPGIELSAQSDTETHILGYFIDIDHPALKEALVKIKETRSIRSQRNCEKLRALGYDVSMEEAKQVAGGALVCRAHFARLLVDKGYMPSVKLAFDTLLANGKPAYDDTQYLTAAQAVGLINEIGGMAFLAHLHLTRKPDDVLEQFVIELKEAGLAGIEGYYTEYTPELQDKYQTMAKRLGLLISGGTDFHAAMKPHISIGVGLGNLNIPYSVLENIKKARSKK
ncbi:MAG TPA: PHP domain-containing protein [Oscillospiraceae bacterium]|nr:PHP domain-containing protein [Oscillospiraceae bacterium]HPF55243.1 PHP domain-containing protein [Clostridiales bacterium]HPK35267.1 PHP domain-containing protein [Oscillospiraceae bacterium]HPR75460.1 PHP domain-containing protein [Oscillospiraceae bacterium]